MYNQGISLKTKSGEVWKGYVHVEENKRLQDVLNDDRRFLPIFKRDKIQTHEYNLVLIHKDHIVTVEEDNEHSRR